MPLEERTRDLYEQIPSYPKPPLVPLPDFDNSSTFFGIPVRKGKLAGWLASTIQAVAGFARFQRSLPRTLEQILRTTNIRGPVLFAPTLSATMALADDLRTQDPLLRAAMLIAAARSLHREVMAGTLPPDTDWQGEIHEMGQYPNLFSTCTTVERRRPRIYKSKETSRVLVLCGRRAFLLDLGSSENVLSTGQIYDALLEIAADARRTPGRAEGSSLGLLTAASHTTQVRMFAGLSRTHARSIEALRNTFFTLCLDLDATPLSYGDAALCAHSTNMANRWFHASLQIVVFGNAHACVICNFSAYLDGNTMARCGKELQRRAAAEPMPRQEERGSRASVEEIPWQVPVPMVRRALRDIQAILDNQVATFELKDFGRRVCTECQISGVSLFTIGLQMAAWRLTGEMLRVTQFINMSRYRCMGLATPTVTTPEVERAVRYLASSSSDSQQAALHIRKAVDAQKELLERTRRSLQLHEITSLFLLSCGALQRSFALSLLAVFRRFICAAGTARLRQRHIVVSFPEASPEIPVIGRPGIRLPYTKHFGLHYQIFDDRTVVTMMPGVQWTVPNGEFMRILEESLQRTISCLKEAATANRVVN